MKSYADTQPRDCHELSNMRTSHEVDAISDCSLKGLRQFIVTIKRFEKLHKSLKSVMNEGKMLKFVKLTDKAYAPVKGSEHAAGCDLRSAYEYIVPANGKVLVKTDLQIQVPECTYGRVAPRSGLAWKHHIDVGAGVIDADYRGNVGVVLFNHSNKDFKIAPGDRIAQLICEKIIYPELKEVEYLNDTARGEGGFGSTGNN